MRRDCEMENEIELKKFDKKFYESLFQKEKIAVKENGKYHTVIFNKEKAGIVGFLASMKNKNEGFVQIILDRKFRGKSMLADAVASHRGKSMLARAEEMLAKKYSLKKLYATIEKTNLASIKSHKKAGFKMIDKERLKKLREMGLLKEEGIRMEKNY